MWSPGYSTICELGPCSHKALQAWLCTSLSLAMRNCLFAKVQGGFWCHLCDEIWLLWSKGPSSQMTHAVLSKDNRINEAEDLLLLEAMSNRFRAGLLE